MKILITLLILIIQFSFVSCSDEITILSAIENGEELADGAEIPFSLHQNWPNPYNPSTNIRYDVYRQIHLKMIIYTEDWKKVSTPINKTHAPGNYQFVFDGKNKNGEFIPSGDYYYVLEGEGIYLTRKMKLLK